MTYGLPLKGDGDEKCISMLHAVDETISRQLRACKAPSSKKRVLEGSYKTFLIEILLRLKFDQSDGLDQASKRNYQC